MATLNEHQIKAEARRARVEQHNRHRRALLREQGIYDFTVTAHKDDIAQIRDHAKTLLAIRAMGVTVEEIPETIDVSPRD
jgi:uncharacterized protein with GYD domain